MSFFFCFFFFFLSIPCTFYSGASREPVTRTPQLGTFPFVHRFFIYLQEVYASVLYVLCATWPKESLFSQPSATRPHIIGSFLHHAYPTSRVAGSFSWDLGLGTFWTLRLLDSFSFSFFFFFSFLYSPARFILCQSVCCVVCVCIAGITTPPPPKITLVSALNISRSQHLSPIALFREFFPFFQGNGGVP